MATKKKLKPKIKTIPALIDRTLSGRPVQKIVADKNTNVGVRYDYAHKKRAFESYVRHNGSLSAAAQETGIDRTTLHKWRGQYMWSRRLDTIMEQATVLGDNALAREMSVAQRIEIDRMDNVEEELVRLLKAGHGLKFTNYAQLTALLLKVSERRLGLRKQAEPAKGTKMEVPLAPGTSETSMTLKTAVELQLRRVQKMAKDAGMDAEDLADLDPDKAVIVDAEVE